MLKLLLHYFLNLIIFIFLMENKSKTIHPNLVPIFLALLAILVLLPALKVEFYHDDYDFLSGALNLQEKIANGTGNFWQVFRHDFISFAGGREFSRYRPASYLVTYFLFSAFGPQPQAFILFAIAVHALVVILFYYFGLMLLKDKQKAFWVTLLFALEDYGLHSVIWPGASVYTQPFALFYLITVMSFIKYLRTSSFRWILISTISLFIAYSFFEGAHVIILVLFSYYLFGEHSHKKKPWYLFPLRPQFYLLYVAIAGWLLILSYQNLGEGSKIVFSSFVRSFSPFGIHERLTFLATYFSREVTRLYGLPIGSTLTLIVAYIHIALLVLIALAILIAFLKYAPSTMWFLPLWFIFETIPRYFSGALYARGFYTMAFPFIPMLVILVFTFSKKITPRLGIAISKTLIAKIILLAFALVQLYRFETFISEWNGYTHYVKSETTQLLSQIPDIKKGDQIFLMFPTKEQDEMTGKDSFIKQIKVLLLDPTVQVKFMLFDSTLAANEFRNPRSHVMVGVPNDYIPYTPTLDISTTIPKDLSTQYRKWIEQEHPQRRKK
jgi:hypothetical protein